MRWWAESKGLVPTAAFEAGAELGDAASAGGGPDHTGLFEALGNDMFAAALDGAGADLEAEGAVAVIVHALLVVAEVGEGVVDGCLVRGCGFEVGDDGGDLSVPEQIEVLAGPAFGVVRAFAAEGMGGLPDVGGSMIPVEDLGCTGEVFLGQVPNPVGAIADHNDPLRLVDA